MTANPMVQSILNDISIKVYQGSAYGKTGSRKERLLVLLCGSDHESEKVLKALDRAAERFGPLTVVLTAHGQRFYPAERLLKRESIGRVYLEAEHQDFEPWLKAVDRIWCPNITQSSLVKLSRGITDSLATCLLWWGLSMQKPVVLTLNAATHRTDSLPEAHGMRSLVETAVCQTADLGAELTRNYCWDPQGAVTETAAAPLAAKLIHEGNLTEQAGPQKRLTLTKGQLITPAARDLAKARGIDIVWK